jgi:hemerythrin-like metal-binding protein
MTRQAKEWIPWDEMLATGHAVLDNDHRRLVAMVNRLADRVVNHKGQDDYVSLLHELVAHTRAHFGREEQLMAECHYPDADAHKSEHARLLHDALEYMSEVEKSSAPSVSMLYFFDQWLTRHIMTWDRDLAHCIASTDRPHP